MPRRREVPKRDILPDPKFGIVDLAKFMNVIMAGGKKAVAERIIYGALDADREEVRQGPARSLHHRAEQRQADGRSEVAAASAARTTRCRSKCARCAAWRWRCAGCKRSREQARREVDGAAPGGRAASKPRKAAAAR